MTPDTRHTQASVQITTKTPFFYFDVITTFCADTTIQSYSLQNDFSHICPFRTTTFTTFVFASTLNQLRFTVSVSFNFRCSRLLLRLSFPFDISFFPLWIRISLSASHSFLFVSSRSIQFHRNPKFRRRDPCSNGFHEVTHRLSYFEVC